MNKGLVFCLCLRQGSGRELEGLDTIWHIQYVIGCLTTRFREVESSATGYQHYSDVIVGVMASQITIFTIVYSIVHSGADRRKHQNSASLASARGIQRWPVNSPHNWPVTRKTFPFVDVIMKWPYRSVIWQSCGLHLCLPVFPNCDALRSLNNRRFMVKF